jgi:membrane protein implicated in regulation of membrane protease activity
MDWLIWVIVAIVLAVGEVFTPGLFFLGLVAVVAAVVALLAALGLPLWVQLIVFILGSIATVAVVRPIARRHLSMPAMLRTGTAALVGAPAVVTQRVDGNGGRVRIGGEEGSARAFDDTDVFEAGTRVEVAEIEGATALVYR